MAYIALRPCSFGGGKFYVGDAVPDALIRPEMVKRLISVGVITEAREPQMPAQSEPEANPEANPEAKLETETNVSKPAKRSASKGKEAGDA